MYNISTEESLTLFTEEDYKLFYLPSVLPNRYCPKCNSSYILRTWRYDPEDPRPWADPIFYGYICKKCGAEKFEPQVKWKKCYNIYGIYLENRMSNEEYEFLAQCGIDDVRDIGNEQVIKLLKIRKEHDYNQA